MRHESSGQSDQPEQFTFFPEDAEFVAVMEEIRREELKKGHHLAPNDEELKAAAARRLAFRKSGKKSYEYHGRNSG